MTFVFDLDDTVCDTDGYSEQYMLNFFREHNMPVNQIAKEVRFAEKKFDWSDEQAKAWYKTFGDQMMLEFPCKKNALEVINSLYYQGHRIVIATARADDWHTEPAKMTQLWLEKVGLKYSKLYVGRIDKEVICDEEHADIFVDDDIKITGRVAQTFKRQDGKKSILMTTSYNKNLPLADEVERIDDFDCFADYLKKYGVVLHLKDE